MTTGGGISPEMLNEIAGMPDSMRKQMMKGRLEQLLALPDERRLPAMQGLIAAIHDRKIKESDREKLIATRTEIMARIRNYAVGATEPQDLFFAPIAGVKKLMEKDGTKIGDYELVEINEAFAVQALADGRELGWDWDRVNVNGGAVALGHPIGASGARILVTLLYAMQDRGTRLGLATLCLGGGNAVALSVERV